MESPTNISQEFIVLVEEPPEIEPIKLMFKKIGKKIPDSITNKDIIPDITIDEKGKKFKRKWFLKFDNLYITIFLFNGKTSSVDYMLFKGDYDLTTGNAGEALVILESTKTADNSSRNTAVYQRITKFTTFNSMYPESNAIKVMFYCNSKWKDKPWKKDLIGINAKDICQRPDPHLFKG